MTTPQTPTLLLDNVFDTIGLYPGGVIDASSEAIGREAFRTVDYRRERSWWQAASDGGGADNWVRVGLSVAALTVDSLFLDRGHNLGGKSIFVEGGPDGATWDISEQFNVPAAVGGSTAQPSMCQTEEGAAWSVLAAPTAARLWWRIRIPHTTGFVPIVTGLIVGLRTQLLGYSTVFDEDAGGRVENSQDSTAGYRALDTVYAWRTAELGLAVIGATEYDATIRTLRERLFARSQPTVLCMDAGTNPERAWMFQYDGTSWSMPKNRVYRAGTIKLREVGQLL